MNVELRAKELALECSIVIFFLVALAGILVGAESHIAVLRGLGAGALVVFGGRFPARILIEATAAPEDEPQATERGTPGAKTPRSERQAA